MAIEHALVIDRDLASELKDLDYQYQNGLIMRQEMINKASVAFLNWFTADNNIQLIVIHRGGDSMK